MGNLNYFVERMRYWCDSGNLGYDQSNRWDIREGGECDCSSLVYWCLYEAGFIDKPSSGNTETLKATLESCGWYACAPVGYPNIGDIVLNEINHVVVCTGDGIVSYASIDENGRATGGESGDQSDRETKTTGFYTPSYGWDWFMRYGSNNSSNSNSGGGFEVSCLQMLSSGSSGAQVTSMQSVLSGKGYGNYLGSYGIDGDFGGCTRDAVIAWQQNHGLEVDGICGVNTWTSLLED